MAVLAESSVKRLGSCANSLREPPCIEPSRPAPRLPRRARFGIAAHRATTVRRGNSRQPSRTAASDTRTPAPRLDALGWHAGVLIAQWWPLPVRRRGDGCSMRFRDRQWPSCLWSSTTGRGPAIRRRPQRRPVGQPPRPTATDRIRRRPPVSLRASVTATHGAVACGVLQRLGGQFTPPRSGSGKHRAPRAGWFAVQGATHSSRSGLIRLYGTVGPRTRGEIGGLPHFFPPASLPVNQAGATGNRCTARARGD